MVKQAITVAIGTTMWLAPVFAQNNQRPIPRPVLRMVDALDADELDVREEATEALKREVLRPSFVNSKMIHRLIRDHDLSPEQRARLLVVDRASFSQSPRAAMGIQFGPPSGTGVSIQKTFPKFPSYKILVIGDVILKIGDEQVNTQDDLRYAIISRDPGETLPLTVQRGEDVLKLDVELGYYEYLDQQPLPERTLNAAWSKRVQRLTASGPEPGSVIDARQGTDVDREPEETSWLGVDGTWDDTARSRLSQGGGQRVIPDPSALDQRVASRQIGQTNILVRNRKGPPVRVQVNANQFALGNEAQVGALITQYRAQLNSRGLTAARKQQLRQQITVLQDHLNSLQILRKQPERPPKP